MKSKLSGCLIRVLPSHQCSATLTYIEDSPEPLFPLNISTFDITDEDNMFMMQATVAIENSQAISDSGATDRLTVPDSTVDNFVVDGNGNSRVKIIAPGSLGLSTLRSDFIEYLRQLTFETDDQSPYIIRNLTVTVQEFPNIISEPTSFFIEVTPVNDRPVLLQTRTSGSTLDDYLPQETNNPGFNSSFLLLEADVDDIDRNSPIAQDFIGLAIVSMENNGLGVWEYWAGDQWMVSPAVNDCSPLFVTPYQRIRLLPAPSQDKIDGNAWFTYRVWDGSSSNLTCVNGSLEITAGMYITLSSCT